ncbi:MAG: hypothetical protein NXH89_10425 [Cyclobacteriaceae bacterium]|nr:hypothetical protein [Cyclobacteriaceae bacterium]
MRRIYIYSLLILSLFLGCSQEDEAPQKDAFIFGWWSAFCTGNCIKIYKLENGRLYADNMNSFREAAIITYKSQPLDSQWLSIAQGLEENFPQFLRNDPFAVIGCPDCDDQGAIYFAFENRTGIMYWQVDTDPGTWPEEIKPYMESVLQAIDQLPQD